MKVSQRARLVHLSQSGAQELERAPLLKGADGGYDEKWLQDIIFRHPHALPLEDLDASYGPLIPVCRELNTGAGPVDILFINALGMPTLVECKLWRNPQARREVVGQILDYAKELSRWGYEDLQREVSLKIKGRSLFDIVHGAAGVEEAAFIDNVTRNLREGRFQLLIVGDGIRQGVENIADYLQNHAGMRFSFGLVEVAVFDFGDGEHLIQPRVLAKTEIISRYAISLEFPDMRLISGAQEEKEEELTASQQDNSIWWQRFLRGLKLDDTSQALPKPNNRYGIWFMMPRTGGNVWITAYRTKAQDQIGVFLRCQRGSEISREVYQRLKEQRAAIEADIGSALSWEEDTGKGFAIALNNKTVPGDDEAQLHWLRDYSNRFINAFRPRVDGIMAELYTGDAV